MGESGRNLEVLLIFSTWVMDTRRLVIGHKMEH